MIVRLIGTVAEVHEDRAIIEHGGLAYEVLICGNAINELTEHQGRQVALHTLHYLEASGVGGNLTPRLIGFPRLEDRAFFTRFITVKNMGARKALRALVMPMSRVAAAIESGDATMLAGLPGIGKRAAEQIIAELKGKVADFALGAPAGEEAPSTDNWTPEQHDALTVMVALGERRIEAQRWIDRAAALEPGPHGPDDWVRLAYRARSNEV